MYRLLALDLDGTLTNNRKEITPYTRKVLLEAQRRGLCIVLASGRPVAGITPLAKQLQLEKFGGYILAFNGGVIINCSTGKPIYENLLDVSVYPHLYEVGNRDDFRILSYVNGHIACEDIENQYVKYEAMLNKMPLMHLDSFLGTINFPEPKCLIVGNPDKLATLETQLAEYYKGKMSIYRSEPFFLEILPLGIDKAKRLEYLCSLLGIKREEMMACGDGFNDLSMIKYAGMGVAMANAQQIVKDTADYITLSNEEDGVAVAVEKFITGDISIR